MKSLLMIFFIFLFIQKDEQLTKLKVSYELPYADFDDTSKTARIDFTIIFNKNICVFERSTQSYQNINGLLRHVSTDRQFFIYNRNEQDGFLFFKSSDTVAWKMNVDSFILQKQSVKFNFDSILKAGGYKQNYKPSNQSKFSQVYKFNSPEIDSIKLFFNNDYNDVPFAFFPTINRFYNSTITRGEIHFVKDIKDSLNYNLIKFYMQKDMEPVEDIELEALIKKFKTKNFTVYKN